MTEPCNGRVKVALVYRYGVGGRYPYKWGAECSCGWRTLSWSWSRKWDMENSGNVVEWIRDNGVPYGGALVNALEHVGLYADDGTFWAPVFPD